MVIHVLFWGLFWGALYFTYRAFGPRISTLAGCVLLVLAFVIPFGRLAAFILMPLLLGFSLRTDMTLRQLEDRLGKGPNEQ